MYYITQEAPVVQTLEIALRDWAKGLRTGAVELSCL
jgi:hypothetical protein